MSLRCQRMVKGLHDFGDSRKKKLTFLHKARACLSRLVIFVGIFVGIFVETRGKSVPSAKFHSPRLCSKSAIQTGFLLESVA